MAVEKGLGSVKRFGARYGRRIRHLLGIIEALECYVLRLWIRLSSLEQNAQRIANPGYNNRPGFHATKRIDTLLKRGQRTDGVHVQLLRLFNQPFYRECPGTRPEISGIGCRFALAGSKFIKVVVADCFLIRCRRLFCAERALDDAGQFYSCYPGKFQENAPVNIQAPRRDFGIFDF